jgi:hypothetical protein
LKVGELPGVSLSRIISGGQTGADRGGLDAAIALGIPHGGWCPKGRQSEDGRIPAKYELQETESSDYPVRTERNVRDSDGTVVFTYGEPQGGCALTVELATKHGKPCLAMDLIENPPDEAARRLREWVDREQIRVLNVAGSRESTWPGIAEDVQGILAVAFGRK